MNTGSFEKRILAIEARTHACPVVLHLADGSVRTIRGDRRHWHKLVASMDSTSPSPLDSELAWIRDSIKIEEPAGRFFLLQSLLKGPNLELEGESEETL